MNEIGLREHKKRQTRAAIADAAANLFAARGFRNVTVDEVASAAGVSRKTVFNYFSSKEDMLFDRDAEIRETLVAALEDRTPGTSVVDVFRELSRGDWHR